MDIKDLAAEALRHDNVAMSELFLRHEQFSDLFTEAAKSASAQGATSLDIMRAELAYVLANEFSKFSFREAGVEALIAFAALLMADCESHIRQLLKAGVTQCR